MTLGGRQSSGAMAHATPDQLNSRRQVLLAMVIYWVIFACIEAINRNGTMS